MTRQLLYLVYPALVLAWIALFWLGPAGSSRRKSYEMHPVHEELRQRAESREDQPAPAFTAESQEGRRWTLAELTEDGPLVLVFINKDCPCNVEAEPWFQRVRRLYEKRVRFAGIIDGTVEDARRYAQANRIDQPILADPRRDIIHDYEAESSAYVVLVDANHRIRRYWPGFSRDMLRDLGRAIADLAGIPERPLDVGDAPESMYTGCPFAPRETNR